MMKSKKESLVILKAMMASLKEHIVEIEVLIEEAEFEIMNDEKRKLLKRRLHEELKRKIEKLQKELVVAEGKKHE